MVVQQKVFALDIGLHVTSPVLAGLDCCSVRGRIGSMKLLLKGKMLGISFLLYQFS